VSDFDERHAVVFYGYHLKGNNFKHNKFSMKDILFLIKFYTDRFILKSDVEDLFVLSFLNILQ